jgi:hypothetical protein
MNVESVEDVRDDKVIVAVSDTRCCGRGGFGRQLGETLYGSYVARAILMR